MNGVWGLRPQRVQGSALAFLGESSTARVGITRPDGLPVDLFAASDDVSWAEKGSFAWDISG